MESITAEKKTQDSDLAREFTQQDGVVQNIQIGYTPQLKRNRSFLTIFGMALAIAAVPYGMGGPLSNAIYGGGQLSIFVGLIVVFVLDACVAVSLAELASRYPTSSGVGTPKESDLMLTADDPRCTTGPIS